MESLFPAVELITTSKGDFNMGVGCLWGPSPEQMHGLRLAALHAPLLSQLTGLAWDQVQSWLKGLYWSWRPWREGHIPALEASMHSVLPKFYFLRVINALWNVIWLHSLPLSLHFFFLLQQCTIVLFFWLFDCFPSVSWKWVPSLLKFPFGGNGGELASSRELPQ